ncbi:MAG: glycosyltransferase [Peptococcia bacterium]|jgi:hypothetical protein
MYIAVIPAHNEGENIEKVLQNLIPCNFQHILLVANGCNDFTEKKALRLMNKLNLELLSFPVPLGLDIPRAIGAAYAKKYRPAGIIFIDGDMTGEITPSLHELLQGLKQGLDLALTNCYPTPPLSSDLADIVFKYRKKVNEKLGLLQQIGLGTPSHGPHAISAHLLSQIPIKALAIPPLVLAFAAQNNFHIDIATTISHDLLGSPMRSTEHAENIAATIIGDCQQALSYLEGTPLENVLQSSGSPSVYRDARRFDLLEHFLSFFH